MKIRKAIFGLVAAGIFTLLAALPAYAQINITSYAGCHQGVAGGDFKGDALSLGCLGPIIANIINLMFMFVGVAMVIFILYGALKFIISRGDPKALQSAKNTITYAIIGGVLVIFMYALVTVLLNILGLPNLLKDITVYYNG